jgi:hypothetical protein
MADADDWTPVDDWTPAAAAAPAPTFNERFEGAPAKAPQQVNAAYDVVRSAGSGLAKGFVGAPGFPGDLANLGSKAVDWAAGQMMSPQQFAAYQADQAKRSNPLPTSSDIVKRVEQGIGKFYQPQTTPGRFAQTAGEFAGNPLNYVGPGGLVGKAGTAVAAGLASEGAGQAAEALDLPDGAQTAARVIGGLAGARTGRGITEAAAERRIPTMDDLHQVSQGHFNAAEGMGVEIHPAHVAGLADTIESDLINSGLRRSRAPETFNAVARLRDPVGPTATISDIEAVRKDLGMNLKAHPTNPLGLTEARASGRAIDAIEDYYANLGRNPAVVNNAHLADRVAGELTAARGDWAAMRKAQELDTAGYKAGNRASSSNSGGNVDNATRQNIAAFLNRNTIMVGGQRRLPGYTDAEFQQMQRVVDGTVTGNRARTISRLLPQHGLGGGLNASIGGAAAFGAGGGLPGAAIGTVVGPLVGGAAKLGSNRSVDNQINQLDRMVRANSATGRARGVGGPAMPPAALVYPSAANTAAQHEPLRLTVP